MLRREFLSTGAVAYGAQIRPNAESENPASAQGGAARRKTISRNDLLLRSLAGCDWLAGRSQVLDRSDANYGAMRSEYMPARGLWRFYQADSQEPFWHTGQAVRTLIVAHEMSRQPKYLEAAVRGGEYLIHAQVVDSAIFGFTASCSPRTRGAHPPRRSLRDSAR